MTLLSAAAVLMTACETFDFGGLIAASTSVRQRFEDSRSCNISDFYPDGIVSLTDDYIFTVATDMHIKDIQLTEFDRFIGASLDGGSLFTVLLGDNLYSAGGSLLPVYERIKAYDDFNCFMAIGNHEVYRDGYVNNYRPLFGPTSYSYTVQTPTAADLCIVLDSANGTLGGEQMKWLDDLLVRQRSAFRHCFVFTHANFFLPGGGVDVVSTYSSDELMKLLDMFARNSVTAVFTGHSHTHDQTRLKTVDYITLNPLLNNTGSEYAVADCTADGKVNYSFVRF